jgi:S1-C subfamily serine protease
MSYSWLTFPRTVTTIATLLLFGGATRGEEPAPAGERHPLLEQLNRETRALYDDVQRSVLRVQLPPQRWLDNYAAKQNPLAKYQNLSPQMRSAIERRVKPAAPEPEALVRADTTPSATQQGTRPDQSTTSDAESAARTYIVVPPPPAVHLTNAPADPVAGARLEANFQPSPTFAPNNVGVVLDEQGHVLVPLFVESDSGDSVEKVELSIRVAGPDGAAIPATLVGSDRQTNLAVLKLDKPLGKPVRLGQEKPADGSLVMSLSPADASGRLIVWNGGTQDSGVVFTSDGEMAGVARSGQFLTGAACRLIADQIIRHGAVKRATLGVIISEIAPGDPARQQFPALGMRAAMKIDQVMAGSAAERAGLKSGDLVVALAGEAVSDIPSFAAAIAAKTGQTELQLIRDGKLLHVTVELQAK